VLAEMVIGGLLITLYCIQH